MKIAIVSFFPPESVYLAKRIQSLFPNTWMVQVSWRSPSSLPANPVPLKQSRLARIEPLFERMASIQKKLLFRETLSPTVLGNTTEVTQNNLKDESFAQEIRKREIDFLITMNAPLLKPQIFKAPKRGTINIHFGINPNYRGSDSFFWAFLLRDWKTIGLTVHHIDDGIDTGLPIFKLYPTLFPWDTTTSALVRATQQLGKVIRSSPNRVLVDRPGPDPVESISHPALPLKSRLFKMRDRTPKLILKAFFARLLPSGWPPFQRGRQTWNFSSK